MRDSQQNGEMENFVVFQSRVVQLKAPKESWGIIHGRLLPLLKGKQFERGGFVASQTVC